MTYTIVDLLGSIATVIDNNGEIWFGSLIGKSTYGMYLVALHGPRTGQAVYANREINT